MSNIKFVSSMMALFLTFCTGVAAESVLRYADPFFGGAGVDLPPPEGVAVTWNWRKAQQGNTYPGPQVPFGMVSVNPYTGAYPSGTGNNKHSFGGKPPYIKKLKDATYGFTHFQQSGTGGIGSYYNFVRICPVDSFETLEGEDLFFRDGYEERNKLYHIEDIAAHPGYYRCTIKETGVQVELTASSKAAYHKYEFSGKMENPRILVDLTAGGLGPPRGAAKLVEAQELADNMIGGSFEAGGFPYYFAIESSCPLRNGKFYSKIGKKWHRGNEEWVKGGNTHFAVTPEKGEMKVRRVRRKQVEHFYLNYLFEVDPQADPTVDLKVAFSFRSLDQARRNLEDAPGDFAAARREAEAVWKKCLERIPYDAGGERDKKIFYSSLYQSLLKPSICTGESPWWKDEAFAVDFATFWDTYKTQLPLVIEYYPEYGAEIVKGIVVALEKYGEKGYMPCGFLKKDGLKKFDSQATGLPWIVLGYAYEHRQKLGGVDWDRALATADGFADLKRVKQILKDGKADGLSYTHTLDVASAFNAICHIARGEGEMEIYNRYAAKRDVWRKAYDKETGLLKDGEYYEGTKWNYSFRPHYDMESRVELAGGQARYTALLDKFFGFDELKSGEIDPQPGQDFKRTEHKNRFEGLNNECDMETPFAYRWSASPERTREVVVAILRHQVGTGPHGLPGNNDSGGLSSWIVLNMIEDMPLVEVYDENK